MLSARDQENLVHGHQQAALSKPLNQNVRTAPPKTPGNKYPKTPLKLLLHDENDPAGLGGKSVLGTKGKGAEHAVIGGKNGAGPDKPTLVTPMGPRVRAPLGMKTTNAKTKAFQTPAPPTVHNNIDKTQAKQTSARRPKPKVSHAETIKLDNWGDDRDPLEEREVEYAPPPTKYPDYESEDFPDGCLNYRMLEGPNLMRGFNKHYNNPLDENGSSLREKELEAALQKAYKETDDRILKAVEDEQWTVSDVPETFIGLNKTERAQGNAKTLELHKKSSAFSNHGPATITSRKAVSALSAVPKETSTAPRTTKLASASRTPASLFSRGKKPASFIPSHSSDMRHTAAAAASRSTLGYNRGRNASNALSMGTRGLSRSASTLSSGSDVTITPARYAQKDGGEDGKVDEWQRLKFLGAFDVDDEDLEPALRGVLPECLRRDEDAEEEFVLELGIA
ncbi:MAG: hypothetical protein M1818_002455 [Claussenomyces sp. TS43310]|nr:MAG: hypothetical protein M1818_002455 [Claussenomyces sp. TS43310]